MIKKFKLFEAEEVKNNKTIYVLIGPPSVGKSTWIKNTFGEIQPFVINRDDIVEKVAEEYGWTYDDLFSSPIKDVEKEGDKNEKYGIVIKSPAYMTWSPLSYDKVLEANGKVQDIFNKRVAEGKGKENIVVDMTNMNSGSRKGALKVIEGVEGEYHKVAVVFSFKGAEETIKKMAVKRSEEMKAQGKSKTIPPAAFDRMFTSFQEVSPEEGFDEVVNVDNTSELKRVIEESEKTPVAESKNTMKYIKTFESFKIFENIEEAEINTDDDELNGIYCADFTPSELKKDEIIYNILVDVDENEHRWAKNTDEVEVHGMASKSTPSKYKVISNDGKEVKIEEIK